MTSRLKSDASVRSGASAATATISATKKILRVDLCMVKTPYGKFPCSKRSANAVRLSKRGLVCAPPTGGKKANLVKLCQRARSIAQAAVGGKGEKGQQAKSKAVEK